MGSPASRYCTRPQPLTWSTGCCPTPNMSSWSSPSSGARPVQLLRSLRPTPWRWAYDDLLLKDSHPSLLSKGLLFTRPVYIRVDLKCATCRCDPSGCRPRWSGDRSTRAPSKSGGSTSRRPTFADLHTVTGYISRRFQLSQFSRLSISFGANISLYPFNKEFRCR